MTIQTLRFRARDFSALRGLQGITDEQIESHLSLYEGYVKRSNALNERLASMLESDRTTTPEYAELKRRIGWEHNGAILHELYFSNLSPRAGGEHGGPFAEFVTRQYGSFDRWKRDLLGVAKMPGVGWAITYLDRAGDTVENYWIDRHDIGHPAGCEPLLVLDVWEHAFSVYLRPTERERYLEDFFANVDWREVDARLQGRHA
jgi:Fe-Mn family superoxide dismutase